MRNIILIGMPGSGKSSVGVVLAKALGYRFVDADLLLQEQEGMLLQEILDSRGVEAFLDLEGQVLSHLRCTRSVIAPGGSCVCRETAMEHLRSLGTVVYLQLSFSEMKQRIHNLETRGIALEQGQTLEDVYDFRRPLYEKYAHLTVSVDGQTLGETVETVKNALKSRE